MTTTMMAALGFVVMGIIVAVTMINALIRRKNQVEFAFASIDAQLKKRYDLIPNLVATAEKYMGYEKGVLQELTQCRVRAAAPHLGEEERVKLDNELGQSLRVFYAVAENYPGLRASEPFLHLQGSLNEAEEQLAASRRAFNAAVTDYNNGCQMFPLSICARMLGYRPKPWFEIPVSEREPVRVWR